MKKIFSISLIFLTLNFFCINDATAQARPAIAGNTTTALKTYLIERDIPGAGQLTAVDLKSIAQKSCAALKELGPDISWVESFVTANKIFCVYRATNEGLVREHAKKGGFPITSITEISASITPKTAE
jgi:hypothetical protein